MWGQGSRDASGAETKSEIEKQERDGQGDWAALKRKETKRKAKRRCERVHAGTGTAMAYSEHAAERVPGSTLTGFSYRACAWTVP